MVLIFEFVIYFCVGFFTGVVFLFFRAEARIETFPVPSSSGPANYLGRSGNKSAAKRGSPTGATDLADGGGFGGDFGKHLGRQRRIALLLSDSLPAAVDPLQVIGNGTAPFGIGGNLRNI